MSTNEPFKKEETIVFPEESVIVTEDNLDIPDTKWSRPPAEKIIPSPEEQIRLTDDLARQRDLKVAKVLNLLLNSITKKDIKEMKTYQKFTALGHLIPIAMRSGVRPLNMTFNNIKVDRASTEDLEKGFIDADIGE